MSCLRALFLVGMSVLGGWALMRWWMCMWSLVQDAVEKAKQEGDEGCKGSASIQSFAQYLELGFGAFWSTQQMYWTSENKDKFDYIQYAWPYLLAHGDRAQEPPKSMTGSELPSSKRWCRVPIHAGQWDLWKDRGAIWRVTGWLQLSPGDEELNVWLQKGAFQCTDFRPRSISGASPQ